MKLSHTFKIYVPSTVNINQAADNTAAVNACLSFLSDRFGGATAQNSRGAWLSEAAGLVLEPVTICYSFTDLKGKLLNRRAVLDYAKTIRDDMAQESVSVEIDGRLFFV